MICKIVNPSQSNIIMKTTLLLLTISFSSLAQDFLVTPDWLNEHKTDKNLVMLQVNRIKLDYDLEHLPGAQFLWPGWLAPNTPEGNMNAIDVKSGEKALRSLGISKDSKVVLCFVKQDIPVTARMFFMLEYLGLKNNVLWLDGGLEAWKAKGYPVSTSDEPMPKRGNFKADALPIIVNKNYVKNKIGDPNTSIVDARFQRYYDGEEVGYPRIGHILGAKNIPYNEMMDASNLFKSKDSLSHYFKPISSNMNNEIVMYCFIGQTASVVYMAGRLLGYPIKLYDGSMEEWSRIPELPMEVTPKEEKK